MFYITILFFMIIFTLKYGDIVDEIKENRKKNLQLLIKENEKENNSF